MNKFFDCGIDLGTTNSCIAIPNKDNMVVGIMGTIIRTAASSAGMMAAGSHNYEA